MKKVIVIIPVDYHNSRKVCELIENTTYSNFDELDKVLIEHGLNGVEGEIMFFEISEFMDAVNNQELDILTDSFISYVNINEKK